MAENNIVYLPYGQEQVNLQEFLTAAANDVQNYLDSRAWSKKRKDSFLRAYQDIMSKGITGATNTSGVWEINYGGEPIDLDSKSKVDKEMYGAAAYYILLKMNGFRSPIKTEEEKKKELPTFNNNTLFNKYLMNNYYGGARELDIKNLWDYLDPRDSTGKRGTSKRRERMIEILNNYKNSIKDGEYSFEGTPFSDINDFRTRIDNAINALKTEDENDDIDALNRLGINSRQWFSNGLGDLSGLMLDGQELTYDQLNQYNLQLAKLKADEKAAAAKLKQEQLKATRFDMGTYLSGGGFTSEQDLFKRYSNTNNLIAKLNLLGEKSSGWSDLEKLDIAGAFNLYKNNLENISKEELDKFRSLRGLLDITPNRIKRIPGVKNFYIDTKTNKIIRPGRKDEINNEPSQDLLANFDPNNRKLSDGWKTEDYIRMGSIASDIAGTIAAFFPTYGTAASAALGTTSLMGNLTADIMDDSVSKLDVAKNFGSNALLTAVGLIPGLGLGAKTGKWAAQIAKWVPRIVTGIQSGALGIDAATGGPIIESFKKAASNPDDLNVLDLKNISYGLSVVAGTARGARAAYNEYKFKPAFNENTSKELTVTTESNKTKVVTPELASKLRKAKSLEEANKILNKEVFGNESGTETIKYNTGIRNRNKRVKINENTKSEGISTEAANYRRYLDTKNLWIKSGRSYGKYIPKFVRNNFKTDYDIYSGNTTRSFPNLPGINLIKNVFNPIPERLRTTSTGSSTSSNTSTGGNSTGATSGGTSNTRTTSTGSNAKPKLPVLSKSESEELQSTLIKQLKENGYLRQGGTITQDNIYNILKNIEL